jgi:flagellar basal body-associated protein FliL
VLSSKKAEDVLTSDGKERLKEELIEGLNEAVALEEPPLTAVFFTEFIIQ